MNLRFDLVFQHFSFLLIGLKNTIFVSLIALSIGLIFGIVIAILRILNNRYLNIALTSYVDLFRSVPQLVVIFWFFYTIPIVTGYQIPGLLSVAIALALLSSAGISEIIRGGILAIDRGQWEAAYAIGMSTTQIYRRIILPQAIVRMSPSLVSSSISLFKASALASAVGVVDLMWQGNSLMIFIRRRMEVFTVVAVLYFLLTYPQAMLVNYLHKKYLHTG